MTWVSSPCLKWICECFSASSIFSSQIFCLNREIFSSFSSLSKYCRISQDMSTFSSASYFSPLQIHLPTLFEIYFLLLHQFHLFLWQLFVEKCWLLMMSFELSILALQPVNWGYQRSEPSFYTILLFSSLTILFLALLMENRAEERMLHFETRIIQTIKWIQQQSYQISQQQQHTIHDST